MRVRVVRVSVCRRKVIRSHRQVLASIRPSILSYTGNKYYDAAVKEKKEKRIVNVLQIGNRSVLQLPREKTALMKREKQPPLNRSGHTIQGSQASILTFFSGPELDTF